MQEKQHVITQLIAISEELRSLDDRAASLPRRKLGVQDDAPTFAARQSIYGAQSHLREVMMTLQNSLLQPEVDE